MRIDPQTPLGAFLAAAIESMLDGNTTVVETPLTCVRLDGSRIHLHVTIRSETSLDELQDRVVPPAVLQ